MKRIVPIKKNGSALLITLAAVALLTVVILAFFSRAEISRKVSFSSTNQIKTRILAGSACDIITGQLRQQIIDGSLSGATYTVGDAAVYIPIDASYIVPKRQTGLNANAVGANTILYVSGNGATLNPYASSPLALGSSVTIDTPSRNGRKETNWFTNGPRLGSAMTPTWVYLTQGQGIATSPSLTAKATEPDYVVGRFAYTVYDLSGLLDANVAGYPTVMDADSHHYPSFKSCPAYADLSGTALGANANQLVSWRNPADGGSAAAYQSYLDNWGIKYGFQQTKVGCNAFLSRQDFLNAVDQGVAGFSSAAASYFTADSCSVDAPSWSPPTPSGASVDYATLAEVGTSANRNIPNVRILTSGTSTHYRDDGTSYPCSVQAGDPLIQRRFSLAKLAWITDTGPKTGISSAAIQACFGLNWDTSNKCWNYVGPTGTTIQSAIATLKDVAAAQREPNFFELLQAGILSSSIGKSASNNSLLLTTAFDKNPTLQIIQIGANIIDQSDTDDYPTAIRIINSTNSQAWNAFGIEDLPGLLSIYMSYYRPTVAGTPYSNNATRDNIHVWLLAELWNPHQTSTLRSGSMSLRATVNEGILQLRVSGSSTAAGVPRDFETSPATLNFSCSAAGFREPGLLTPANSSSTTGEIFSDGAANFAGFHVGSITAPDNFAASSSTYSTSLFGVDYPLTLELQYQHPTLGWLPYHRLEGITNYAVGSSLNRADETGSPKCNFYRYVYPDGTPFLCRSFVKSDPRSTRFGLFGCPLTNKLVGATLRPERAKEGLQTQWGTPIKPEFQHTEAASAYGTPHAQWGRPGMWADNDPSSGVTNNSWYSDTDGIFRPGDGFYGAYPQAQNAASSSVADTDARPRILNRPFRNVAELGYVFRDEPFKTLDLFSSQSADSALADLFGIADTTQETPLVAGKINVNTADQAVLAALLSQAFMKGNASSPLSQLQAASIASTIVSHRAATAAGTVRDPGDWARWLASQVLDNALSGDNKRLKEQREGIIRASASFVQTRTWDLLIDVTAQSGRFARNSTDAKDFIVEGAQHCWLHVSIDRFTGKIVRQTSEIVSN